MAISYTLDETFTGKRTQKLPDPEKEGSFLEEEIDVTDIIVTFTDDSYTPDKVHTRNVNVVFDSNGDYDDAATKVRVAEVMGGVQHKMTLGLI